jgi:hypothetical protein
MGINDCAIDGIRDDLPWHAGLPHGISGLAQLGKLSISIEGQCLIKVQPLSGGSFFQEIRDRLSRHRRSL